MISLVCWSAAMVICSSFQAKYADLKAAWMTPAGQAFTSNDLAGLSCQDDAVVVQFHQGSHRSPSVISYCCKCISQNSACLQHIAQDARLGSHARLTWMHHARSPTGSQNRNCETCKGVLQLQPTCEGHHHDHRQDPRGVACPSQTCTGRFPLSLFAVAGFALQGVLEHAAGFWESAASCQGLIR